MNNRMKRSLLGLMMVSLAGLVACGGSGQSSESATTGFISLGVSDGPIHEAEAVCITFDEIELHGNSGTSTIFDLDETIDLLNFQGTDFAPLIQSAELEAGSYQWLRLGIDAEQAGAGGADCLGEGSYIVMVGGDSYNLRIPSGAQTGLKLVGGITIPAGGAVDFTAEFDLARSITAPPGASPDIIMRPVIRLVDNVEVGALTGMVADSLAEAEACQPSVYVFNDGATPNGIDGSDDDPISTAMVSRQENDDGSMTWNYTVGFLLGGADDASAVQYEAAFTCNGADFEPVAGLEAPIVAGETTMVNFEAPAP